MMMLMQSLVEMRSAEMWTNDPMRESSQTQLIQGTRAPQRRQDHAGEDKRRAGGTEQDREKETTKRTKLLKGHVLSLCMQGYLGVIFYYLENFLIFVLKFFENNQTQATEITPISPISSKSTRSNSTNLFINDGCTLS